MELISIFLSHRVSRTVINGFRTISHRVNLERPALRGHGATFLSRFLRSYLIPWHRVYDINSGLEKWGWLLGTSFGTAFPAECSLPTILISYPFIFEAVVAWARKLRSSNDWILTIYYHCMYVRKLRGRTTVNSKQNDWQISQEIY